MSTTETDAYDLDNLPPAVDDHNNLADEPDLNPPPPKTSDEAPYGYTKSGRVRKRPLGSRSKTAGTSKPRKGGTDYRDGLNGVFQITATALAIAGDKNETLLADAIAVNHHGPNVSEALNALAAERPEVAAVLDKVLQVGPYGLVIGAIMPLIAQLLTNHGVAPAGMLGTVDKKTLIAATMSQAA